MSEASDYHFQDETCLFISPKGQDFGLGVTRVDDGIHVGLADEEGDGAFVVLTDDQAATTGRELLRLSVGPVYESPEELAAEIVRLREGWDRLAAEIPRLYGRETAADLPHDSEYVTALHDVLVAMKRIERGDAALTGNAAETYPPGMSWLKVFDEKKSPSSSASPAPRDSELAQQLRPIVKRYGGPNVAYEAARQSGQQL
ncbi:hypothetical protein [Nocardiopsis dassonvillei]|uniref:hypothetical protein n=1 Tax=Nocardiopsis dassonvillei TaxID=2014 RepID=UPI00157D302B|nr:hypothetical protein [Nocardiopsis dassonvillei]